MQFYGRMLNSNFTTSVRPQLREGGDPRGLACHAVARARRRAPRVKKF